jgi:hypothetical protein
MCLRSELRDISREPKEFRKFGFLIGALLLLDGAWSTYHHRESGWWLLGIGAVLMLIAGTVPRLLAPLHRVWMTFGVTMGWVVSNIILVLIFFLLVTPLAFFARLAGKDFLSHKLEPNASTYWVERKKSSRDQLERQF